MSSNKSFNKPDKPDKPDKSDKDKLTEEKELKKLEKELNKELGIRNSKYYKKDGVIGLCRKFDEKLLIKYDYPARDRIKEILGDYVSDHPDPYAQDLVINSKTCKYKYLELQVCSYWEKTEFPEKNVFVYARKARYGDDTLLLTLNKFLTRGYLFCASALKNIKPERIRKYSRDYVYFIPWNQVVPIYLDTLDKETFELF